jgi:hypothetical protein
MAGMGMRDISTLNWGAVTGLLKVQNSVHAKSYESVPTVNLVGNRNILHIYIYRERESGEKVGGKLQQGRITSPKANMPVAATPNLKIRWAPRALVGHLLPLT